VTLLLDLNVSPRVATLLGEKGYRVLRVPAIMDARSSDEAILTRALELGAVVVTRDQDFSALLAISGAGAPSLINLRFSTVDAGEIANIVADVARTFEEDLAVGAIVTVDDARVRIHRLPIGG
jgi:predicted nuclease of predicted toxin-antitoxin system